MCVCVRVCVCVRTRTRARVCVSLFLTNFCSWNIHYFEHLSLEWAKIKRKYANRKRIWRFIFDDRPTCLSTCHYLRDIRIGNGAWHWSWHWPWPSEWAKFKCKYYFLLNILLPDINHTIIQVTFWNKSSADNYYKHMAQCGADRCLIYEMKLIIK